MAQSLRALVALPGGSDSILNTHILAHNHLYLQFQEIRLSILTSLGTRHASGTQAYLQAKRLYNTIKIWKVLQMEGSGDREEHALSHVFLGNFTLFYSISLATS